jgi:hypothetical protein
MATYAVTVSSRKNEKSPFWRPPTTYYVQGPASGSTAGERYVKAISPMTKVSPFWRVDVKRVYGLGSYYR